MADRQNSRSARVGPLDNHLVSRGSAAVSLSACENRDLVNLRCRSQDDAVAAAAADALGCRLPTVPNRSNVGDTCAIVWLGPDEWLIMADDGEAANIERRLRAAVCNDPWLSVVDVSHNYAGLLLGGKNSRDVLAKGCPLDLHARSFQPGDAAQTVLAGSRVLLRATDAPDSIEVWVRNSFARYTADWLTDAMAEFPEA